MPVTTEVKSLHGSDKFAGIRFSKLFSYLSELTIHVPFLTVTGITLIGIKCVTSLTTVLLLKHNV
jgi:hypothetical protein